MITGVLLARELGPEARGELAIAILWPACFQTVAAFGLPQAIAFFSGRHRDDPSGVATAALGLGIVQACVVAAAGWLLLPTVLQSQPVSVLAMSRVYLLATAVDFLGGYGAFMVLGVARLHLWNAMRALGPCSYLLGLLLLLQAGALDGPNVVRVLLVSAGIQATLQLGVLTRLAGLRREVDAQLIRSILANGGRTWPESLGFLLRGRIDQLLMSLLLQPLDLGLYAVAFGWATGAGLIGSAIGPVAFARTASSRSASEASGHFRAAFQLSLLVNGATGALLLAATPAAVLLLFGDDFGPAIPAAGVLVVASALNGIRLALADGLRGLGRPSVPSVAEWMALAVTVCALPPLLSTLGILGAAFAACLGSASALAVLAHSSRSALRRPSASGAV